MQLFVTNQYIYNKGDYIDIVDMDIMYQLTRVLRAGNGYHFFLQDKLVYGSSAYTQSVCRYSLSIDAIYADHISAKILSYETLQSQDICNTIAISMTNKREKIELIIQKLTEIGIQKIIIFISDRSIIRRLEIKKLDRLYKISREALEQSWGYILPQISFANKLTDICLNDYEDIYIAHQDGSAMNSISKNSRCYKKILLIGPEGGRSDSELVYMDQQGVNKVCYGKNIYRTETAAIIGGYILSSRL